MLNFTIQFLFPPPLWPLWINFPSSFICTLILAIYIYIFNWALKQDINTIVFRLALISFFFKLQCPIVNHSPKTLTRKTSLYYFLSDKSQTVLNIMVETFFHSSQDTYHSFFWLTQAVHTTCLVSYIVTILLVTWAIISLLCISSIRWMTLMQ